MANRSNFFKSLGRSTGAGLAGAGTGALAGSVFGPVGTGIGAGLGGLGGILSQLGQQQGQYQQDPGQQQQGQYPQSQQAQQAGMFKGAPGQFLQSERFSPQQQPYFNQAAQMGMQGLQNPMQGFEPISKMATSNWEKNILPQLKAQFADVDAQESSGYQEALGQSGADLATQLGALGSQYGLQQQGLSQKLLGLGLEPQYETSFQNRQPSLIESLLGMLAQGGGQAAGAYFGAGGKMPNPFGRNNSNMQNSATNTATQQNPYNAPQQQYQPYQSFAYNMLGGR